MKILTATLLACLSAAALSGCATAPGQCDPRDRDASMLTKMNCDYTGGYDAEVKQKEKGLTDARDENALFHKVYDDIQAQQTAVHQDLATQQRQQAALNASMGQLLGQLKARHADQGQVQKKIAALEQQLKTSQAKPVVKDDPVQLAAKQDELKALQKKVTQLQFSLGYE
jgi:chromosome segregation ATPase